MLDWLFNLFKKRSNKTFITLLVNKQKREIQGYVYLKDKQRSMYEKEVKGFNGLSVLYKDRVIGHVTETIGDNVILKLDTGWIEYLQPENCSIDIELTAY